MNFQSNNLPNLFIVGAARAGTTFLWKSLGLHPQVYMSPTKEPAYFADEWEEQRCTDIGAYLKLFEDAHQPIRGEASVAYLLSRGAAHRIQSFNPEAKILISLRNPIDVIASLHAYLVYTGKQPILDLNEALRVCLCKDFEPPRGVPWADYLRAVQYSGQIARFVERFGDQVHVLLYDDLKARTGETLGHIARFLDIREDVSWPTEPENVRKAPRSVRVARLLHSPPIVIRVMARWSVPRALRRRAVGMLRKVNTKPGRAVGMSISLREVITARLEADIRTLESMLGRDLGHWLEST